MSSTQWMVVVGLLLTAAGPASAQSGGDFVPVTDAMLQDPDPADWLMWRRTLDSWGYSPRDQIDRGASVIKCCYAATGMYMTAAAAVLRASANASTSLSHNTTHRRDSKMSRRGSRRVARPACIAGVRVSRQNFSAPCGRTKL